MRWYKFRAYGFYYFAIFVSKFVGINIPPVPSASVIVVENGKLLVVKLSYEEGYALPGGCVQRMETIEEAVTRETKEETGLDLNNLIYLGSYGEKWRSFTVNSVFTGKVKGKLQRSKEGIPMWVDPAKVFDELVYIDNKKAVKQYFNL